jgi:hypothetical protein
MFRPHDKTVTCKARRAALIVASSPLKAAETAGDPTNGMIVGCGFSEDATAHEVGSEKETQAREIRAGAEKGSAVRHYFISGLLIIGFFTAPSKSNMSNRSPMAGEFTVIYGLL